MTRVVVIGGGIAGASAAARLAQKADVTLLEAETQFGYHSSGRSAAMFEENYGTDTTCTLNRASRPYHEAQGVLSPRGLMIVTNAEDEEQFQRDLVTMRMNEVNVSAAFDRVPVLAPNVIRAAVHDDAHDIDTDRLLQGFLKEARRAGAVVKSSSRVTAIERAACWQISDGQTEIEADILVNAAGAWADEVASLAGVKKIGLQPNRRSMARLPAPGDHDVRRWPMLFGPGESWYAKPDGGSWLVSPAEEHPIKAMDAWPDDMVLAEGLHRYGAYVTEHVKRPIATWAGLRTFSPDRSLVIGADPDMDDFFWCAGQGGYGIQSSPAASQCLADLVFGEAPVLTREVVDALSPARFR